MKLIPEIFNLNSSSRKFFKAVIIAIICICSINFSFSQAKIELPVYSIEKAKLQPVIDGLKGGKRSKIIICVNMKSNNILEAPSLIIYGFHKEWASIFMGHPDIIKTFATATKEDGMFESEDLYPFTICNLEVSLDTLKKIIKGKDKIYFFPRILQDPFDSLYHLTYELGTDKKFTKRLANYTLNPSPPLKPADYKAR